MPTGNVNKNYYIYFIYPCKPGIGLRIGYVMTRKLFRVFFSCTLSYSNCSFIHSRIYKAPLQETYSDANYNYAFGSSTTRPYTNSTPLCLNDTYIYLHKLIMVLFYGLPSVPSSKSLVSVGSDRCNK